MMNGIAFWDIFVEDAKCSMLGSPDYDKLNTDVDIYYEFESDAHQFKILQILCLPVMTQDLILTLTG